MWRSARTTPGRDCAPRRLLRVLELSDDVFAELGRFTLAAIELEDLTDAMCALIHPADPRDDRRQISHKIRDARADLKRWANHPRTKEVDLWLERALSALRQRNAVMHAVPLELPRDGESALYALGQWTRDTGDYFERELTVAAIREVRDSLTDAHEGFSELLVVAYVIKNPERRVDEGDPLVP